MMNNKLINSYSFEEILNKYIEEIEFNYKL